MLLRRCNKAQAASAAASTVTSMARSAHLMQSTPPSWMRIISVLLLLVLTAACLGCAHAAASPSLETRTLLTFKGSITDGGGDLANWSPADVSPCTWTGVRCSGGVVTELSLHDMNVSGPVPIGLGTSERPSHIFVMHAWFCFISSFADP